MSLKIFKTNNVRTQTAQTQHGEYSTPLFLTSSFFVFWIHDFGF